jgi:antitoxin (DNA-binding transcriptional repressor) of toxin-antitoxin stability system
MPILLGTLRTVASTSLSVVDLQRDQTVIVKTVDIREAQAQLSELVSLALEGNEVIILVNDKPMARLVPVASPNQPRVAGLNKGQIWVSEDFDEPLPEEFLTR